VCESKVFLKEGGKEELVMEDVIRIEVLKEKIRLYDIFGESKEVKGKIVLVDMSSHRVVIEGGEM